MDIDALTEQLIGRLFIQLEASGRHAHVTEAQAQVLFGHKLTPKRDLSQPGQFLANERVSVVGPKGQFENVAVLGPERPAGQVEISLTDGRVLGIDPPVRLSGDVAGTPSVTLIGPCGKVQLKEGLIAAQRHIHMSVDDAKRFGVKDQQVVRLKTYTSRPVVFENMPVRVHPIFQTRVHLDYDEANACGFQNGDLGRILL